MAGSGRNLRGLDELIRMDLDRADREGRTARTERPGFGGAVVTNTYEYDDEGRLAEGVTGGAE